MDVHKDSAVLSRIEVVETGRRRRWTSAEKLRIVEESFSGRDWSRRPLAGTESHVSFC
jgi:transposase-like protein